MQPLTVPEIVASREHPQLGVAANVTKATVGQQDEEAARGHPGARRPHADSDTLGHHFSPARTRTLRPPGILSDTVISRSEAFRARDGQCGAALCITPSSSRPRGLSHSCPPHPLNHDLAPSLHLYDPDDCLYPELSDSEIGTQLFPFPRDRVWANSALAFDTFHSLSTRPPRPSDKSVEYTRQQSSC